MEEVLFANLLSNIFPAFQQCVYKWKADKAFFLMTMQQDNRKKRAAMLPYIPRRVVFIKRWASEGFLVGVPLLRQLMLTALFFVIQSLCFLANLGGDTTASGSRHGRVWEEVRSRLGRDTTASGTVFANKYRIWFIRVVASCFTRCCYVACAMWWIYIEVALAFGTEILPLKTSKASMIFYCV